MRILFFTDNFPPEVNAPATRTYEHCREWVKAGNQVTVITCAPNFPQGKVYEGYSNKLYQKEEIDGIKIIRVWSYIAANEGFVKRILDYTSYAFTALIASFFVKADIIIATSPQFFTAVAGRLSSFFKRKPWIMEVRDLWPESIRAVGAMDNNRIYNALERLELILYRSARKVIVVTEAFQRNIIKRNIDPAKLEIIKNGVRTDIFYPRQKNMDLVSGKGLENKLVVGYVGTHGMAHALHFILDAAKKVEDDPIHFLFVGDGAEKKNLVEKAAKESIRNVTFMDSIAKDRMPEFLSLIDIALVNLKRSETFKTVIPSKIFENAAMEKPILIGVDGEARELVESFGAGVYFEPENEKEFLLKLKGMTNELTKGNDVFREGCKNLAKAYDRKRLAGDMLKLLRLEL